MINWLIIGKFIVLNHWCHLLNVRASFVVKGHNKADPVSRRPDYPSGHWCPPAQASWDVALWWDGKVPGMCYQSNATSLLVHSADIVSVDDDFLTNWKFLVFLIRWWIKARWKGHGLNKSSDGLYTHHDRLVIPRLAQDMCILVLTECCYNVGEQIGNACWQLWENVSWGNVCTLLDWNALSSKLSCLHLLKSDLAMFFFALYPLVLLTTLGK